MQFGKILQKWVFFTAATFLLCFSSLSLASIVSHEHFCELLSHFRPLFFLILLALTTLLLAQRAWKSAFIGIVFTIVSLLPLCSAYGARAAVPGAHTSLKILQMNVHGGKNSNSRAAIALIRELNPDIIGFSEITSTWASNLKVELKDYRYRTIDPDHGGIAVFSKLPLAAGEVRYLGKIKRPRIYAQVKAGNSQFTLVFAHPVTPLHSFELRNEELATLASEAVQGGSFVLAGDLNCTPWSYYFDKLKRDGRLNDSMCGFGIQPSWNTAFPVLPIDHCLVSKDIVTIDRQICRDIGSDHFPVYVELGLRPN